MPRQSPLILSETEDALLEKVEAGCSLDSGMPGTSWDRVGSHLRNGVWVETCTQPTMRVPAPCPGGSQNTGREAYILQAENWRIPLQGTWGAQKKRQKLTCMVLIVKKLGLHSSLRGCGPLLRNPTFLTVLSLYTNGCAMNAKHLRGAAAWKTKTDDNEQVVWHQ